MSTIKRATNWGYCSELCETNSQAVKLQEAQLTVLDPDDCAKFNSTILSYRPDGEVCAANKISYPTMKIYVRKKLRRPRNGKKYVFVYLEDKINRVSLVRGCVIFKHSFR